MSSVPPYTALCVAAPWADFSHARCLPPQLEQCRCQKGRRLKHLGKPPQGGGGMIHTVVFGRPQLLVVLDFFSRLLVQRFICTVMVRLLVSRCICTVRDCLLRCANKMFFNFQFRVRHGATTRPSGLNAVRGVSPTLPGDEDISEWLSPPCLILRDQAGSTCSRAR